TTDEAYGAGGNLLWRYMGSPSTNRSFVPFSGGILAEYYSGGTLFDHPDELGSIATSTSYNGSLCQEQLFYPFGQLWTGAGSCGMHQTFAQLPDYDAETDQYNTLNRHYTPSGRWMSPDPGGVKVVKLDDPQTWNMYAYVRNNPTTLTDPTGLYLISPQESTNIDSGEGMMYVNEWDAQSSDEKKDSAAPAQKTQPDCNCGTNARYKTANQAATAALNKIFGKSEKEHVEYGGRIYKNSDGTYSYTTAVTQHQTTAVDVDAGGADGSRIPAGKTNAGIYHTHETVPGYNADQFSVADAQHAVHEHVPNYIETPAGLTHEIDATHATSYLTAPQYTWRANGPIP